MQTISTRWKCRREISILFWIVSMLLFLFIFSANAEYHFLVSPSEQLNIETKNLLVNTKHVDSGFRPSLWMQDPMEEPPTVPNHRIFSSKVFCKLTATGPGPSVGQNDLDAMIRQQILDLAGITISDQDIRHYHLTNGIGSYYVIYHPELARRMGAEPGVYDWATVGIIRVGKYSFSVNGCSQTNNGARYQNMVSVLESMSISRATKTEADAALLDAAYTGDFNGAQTSVATGAEIDATNLDGWTPLMFAVKNGHDNIALYLIEKGADVRRKTSTEIGSTVLDFAADGKKLNVIDAILNKGADVNGKGKDGLTPLEFAAWAGNLDVAKLLISRGADVNLFGNRTEHNAGVSPLTAASCKGHIEVMELLLAHGVKIDMTNESGDTALMIASKEPQPKAVSWLIKNGANVNARGIHGNTALIYAAYNGRLDTIKILLDAGADPSATGSDSGDPNDRYSAIDVALQQGHPEAAELIRNGKRPRPVRL